MDLFIKYQEEIKEDLQIDQINLMDRQLRAPALKHKWVARLMEQKRNKNKLEKNKKELKENVLKQLESGGIPTGVPKASIKEKVESSDIIKKINEEIEDVNLLIEYLEKVEKIFSSITYDIRNITEITKLETT
jgi:hypothetical protein